MNKISVRLPDNLKMDVNAYAGGDKTPTICLHGLTRNASDFGELAPLIAETGRDAYAVSFRGRGLSDRDNNYLNYHPVTYRDDILCVLETLGLSSAIFIGTSLGGIVTMLTNQTAPNKVKAAVINDIGPELAPEGIARIAGYVGENFAEAASLEEAASRIKAINDVAFPDAPEPYWIEFAKRTFRQTENGGWTLDYDPNIARALAEVGTTPDLWPAFKSLKDTPTLLIRGAISDLLSPEIVEKMQTACPAMQYTEIPRIGHAPMLTEPSAWSAIKSFLSTIDEAA